MEERMIYELLQALGSWSSEEKAVCSQEMGDSGKNEFVWQ